MESDRWSDKSRRDGRCQIPEGCRGLVVLLLHAGATRACLVKLVVVRARFRNQTMRRSAARSYRSECTVALGTQPFIVGSGDDSSGAGIRGEDFSRVFASCNVDRRR